MRWLTLFAVCVTTTLWGVNVGRAANEGAFQISDWWVPFF